MVDVASNFSDADMGDSLTYTAMSDMMSYATASVSGSMVTIMGVAPGSATITVTATDMHGEMAMQDHHGDGDGGHADCAEQRHGDGGRQRPRSRRRDHHLDERHERGWARGWTG